MPLAMFTVAEPGNCDNVAAAIPAADVWIRPNRAVAVPARCPNGI